MNDKFLIRFNFVFNIFLAIAILFGGLVWADSNGIWHDAEDIRGGIIGSDEQADITEFTFINPLNLDNLTYYQGVELDTRYVNENQANSITSEMIIDGTITGVDINTGSIQSRVSGSCSPGYSIRSISESGGVVCEYDNAGSSGITSLKVCSGTSTTSCCTGSWSTVGRVDNPTTLNGVWLCYR